MIASRQHQWDRTMRSTAGSTFLSRSGFEPEVEMDERVRNYTASAGSRKHQSMNIESWTSIGSRKETREKGRRRERTERKRRERERKRGETRERGKEKREKGKSEKGKETWRERARVRREGEVSDQGK